MKKVLLILAAALLLGTQAFGQISPKLGYTLGIDLAQSKVNVNNNGMLIQHGFYAGAEYKIDLPWVKGLVALPGAYINAMFGSGNEDLLNYPRGKYTDISIYVPAFAGYYHKFNRKVAIMGYGGPALSLGLIKKCTRDFGGGATSSQDFYANDYTMTHNRAMLLLGIGVGVDLFGKLRITSGSDFGLTPFFNNNQARISRSAQLRFSVGYLF